MFMIAILVWMLQIFVTHSCSLKKKTCLPSLYSNNYANDFLARNIAINLNKCKALMQYILIGLMNG